MNAPWVAPGTYTLRLTANGKSVTQPITVRMDPRVKVTPEVQRIFTLTAQMEQAAAAASVARKEARDLVAKLKARPQSAANDALIRELEDIAPEPTPAPPAREGFPPPAAAAPPAPTLTNIGGQLVGAVMPMQSAEMPPTAAELAACAKQQAAYATLMTKWAALKTRGTKL